MMDSLFSNAQELKRLLEKEEELSLVNHYNDVIRKFLILSVASSHEKRVTTLIANWVRASTEDVRVLNFVEKKALKRNYHTLFNWDSKNINQFLSLFGDEAKKKYEESHLSTPKIRDGMNSFIEIGSARNILVHNDFASNTSFSYTIEEIRKKENEANDFLEDLTRFLME